MLPPLLDVHELVRNQTGIELLATTHEDPPTDRHRRDPGSEPAHDHDPSPRAVDPGHVSERGFCLR